MINGLGGQAPKPRRNFAYGCEARMAEAGGQRAERGGGASQSPAHQLGSEAEPRPLKGFLAF